MGTDSFGRSVSPGDTIWVPAKVTSISSGVFNLNYTNADGSSASITAQSGTAGQTTNPDEADRPPR